MLRRLLNIASIVCTVCCVVLIVLWVRSYSHSDAIWVRLNPTKGCGVSSELGRLLWHYDDRGMTVSHTAVGTMPIGPAIEGSTRSRNDFMGFNILSYGRVKLVIPIWFAILFNGLLVWAIRKPWPPWRMSVREFFVLASFMAILLSISGWLDRGWIR